MAYILQFVDMVDISDVHVVVVRILDEKTVSLLVLAGGQEEIFGDFIVEVVSVESCAPQYLLCEWYRFNIVGVYGFIGGVSHNKTVLEDCRDPGSLAVVY